MKRRWRFKLDQARQKFLLTPTEKRVVVFVLAAFVLGLLFVVSSVRAALSKSNQHARQLLLASVLYLPILFGVMVLNR